MTVKTKSIAYWTTTILVALPIGIGGIAQVAHAQAGEERLVQGPDVDRPLAAIQALQRGQGRAGMRQPQDLSGEARGRQGADRHRLTQG